MMQTTTHPYDNCCFKTSSITGESSVDHNHNQSHRSLGCSKPSLDIVSREWWRSLSLDCNTRLLALRNFIVAASAGRGNDNCALRGVDLIISVDVKY
ncbi:uncharacterized protein LOC143470546 isoform X3 [Clavelina lepadiformis]